jgi:hypothetical protein
MLPKWKAPLQSAVSVTEMVSSPYAGCVACTTTPGSVRSGDDVVLHPAQKELGDGAGENVTMIWSPCCARPALAPPFTIRSDDVKGVTAAEGADGELEPAALVAVTVKVYVVPLVSPLRS